MHVYFLRVFTYTEVMGLAKVAACLSKGTKIFPFLLIYSQLRALCLPISHLHPLCVYLSHIYLDLPLHSSLHLFMVPYPNPSSGFLCSHCNALSCFHFVLFFVCVCFLFLIQFSLPLSCSHWMDQFISFRVWALTKFFLCIVTSY